MKTRTTMIMTILAIFVLCSTTQLSAQESLPLAIGVEYYYMIETPDTFGPEHQLRLIFTPVLPAPEWSRNPLF